MRRNKKRLRLLMVAFLVGFGLVSFCGTVVTAQKSAVPEIPQVNIVFAHAPYVDHTQAIIGIEKGWFEEVGITITPKPYGKVISGQDAGKILSGRGADVISGSPALLLSAYKTIPPFKVFVLGDIFQGNAIMAQPKKGYKSVQEFVQEGLEPKEALRKAVGQLKGKRIGYPPIAPIQAFLTVALKKAGLTLEDMAGVMAPDAENIAAMVAGRLDFQTGGAPSRMALEERGFKPIITATAITRYAKPSPESEDLRVIFHDGWVALDSWINNNYDSMLRMSSVMFRILRFMNEHQEEAIEIQRPFVNTVAGTNLSEAGIRIIYESLDPFVPFEQQWIWHLDPGNSYYEGNVTGARILFSEEKGLLEPGTVKLEDVSIAGKVYREFLYLRDKSYFDILAVERLIDYGETIGAPQEDIEQAVELLKKAKHFYEIYDYLDASRFVEAAKSWAEYAMSSK